MSGKPNVVVILGSTGTGKTKLSIDLAKQFNGEVISADSMQIYHGSPIATNIVTKEEMDGIPHYLIDLLNPFEEATDVSQFAHLAISRVREIHSRGAVPIIVGGTNQYIEALLWEDALTVEALDEPDPELESLSPLELYEKLAKIDPERALTLHENDTRRVMRSLKVYRTTGRTHSDWMSLQLNEARSRFSCCFLCLSCSREVLEIRLEKRIREMEERGLFEEMETLYKLAVELDCKESLFSGKGMFQAIGIKEFIPFFEFLSQANDMQDKNEKAKILEECSKEVHLHSRQYAISQESWIKGRFASRCPQPIHLLDTSFMTNVANPASVETERNAVLWKQNVFQPAFTLVRAFLEGKDVVNAVAGLEMLPRPVRASRDALVRKDCECGTTIVGLEAYENHRRGRIHRMRMKKIRKNANRRYPKAESKSYEMANDSS